jgi:hypothetical protein
MTNMLSLKILRDISPRTVVTGNEEYQLELDEVIDDHQELARPR